MRDIIAKLTAKDDKYACAIADKIISESQDTDEWYEYFDEFASLLNHPNSLVRNRVLYILATNAQWDNENRFDTIISDYLAHVTDDKLITARQCNKLPPGQSLETGLLRCLSHLLRGRGISSSLRSLEKI